MEAFLTKDSKVSKRKQEPGKDDSTSKLNDKISKNFSDLSIQKNESNTNISNSLDVEMEIEDEEKNKSRPWVEKYRPNKIEEISHQTEVVSALHKSVASGKVPHMLMYGPPGTGKTSTILALAKELYGPVYYRNRILELNASDDRGIAVVREKIKKFAQKKIVKIPSSENYPCPPIQIIILDEADSMTVDAQAALRRTIEVYSTHTRFCII